jgi:hypothetical protein
LFKALPFELIRQPFELKTLPPNKHAQKMRHQEQNSHPALAKTRAGHFILMLIWHNVNRIIKQSPQRRGSLLKYSIS